LVVEDAFTMQLVVLPITLVGNAAICVLKDTLSMHFVIEPITLIFTSFVVIEDTVATTHAVLLLPFVIAFAYFLLHYFAHNV
jgi:hypothetical protein